MAQQSAFVMDVLLFSVAPFSQNHICDRFVYQHATLLRSVHSMNGR